MRQPGVVEPLEKALLECLHEALECGRRQFAIIQAEGANPLYQAYQRGFDRLEPVKADTIATAVKIGNPVNYPKAARAIQWTNGVVEQVSDQEIMDAKALIDATGIRRRTVHRGSVSGSRRSSGIGPCRARE